MATQPPKLTDAQIADIHRMKGKGNTVVEIADAYGVSQITIRRVLDPKTYSRDKEKRQNNMRLYPIKPDLAKNAVRITDYPQTLTAALCGDPTPQRRRLMQEGVI
jgi:hypothetical protein